MRSNRYQRMAAIACLASLLLVVPCSAQFGQRMEELGLSGELKPQRDKNGAITKIDGLELYSFKPIRGANLELIAKNGRLAGVLQKAANVTNSGVITASDFNWHAYNAKPTPIAWFPVREAGALFPANHEVGQYLQPELMTLPFQRKMVEFNRKTGRILHESNWEDVQVLTGRNYVINNERKDASAILCTSDKRLYCFRISHFSRTDAGFGHANSSLVDSLIAESDVFWQLILAGITGKKTDLKIGRDASSIYGLDHPETKSVNESRTVSALNLLIDLQAGDSDYFKRIARDAFTQVPGARVRLVDLFAEDLHRSKINPLTARLLVLEEFGTPACLPKVAAIAISGDNSRQRSFAMQACQKIATRLNLPTCPSDQAPAHQWRDWAAMASTHAAAIAKVK